MRKILKGVGIALLAVVCVAILGILALTVTEFKPAAVETVSVEARAEKTLAPGQSLKLVTWNVGYGGLGAASDFFMDGGSGVRSADKATVEKYLSGIGEFLAAEQADLALLQEVDESSTRSFGIDERGRLLAAMPEASCAFAKNFSVPFVPYPVPPIGKVQSGLFTLSRYAVDSAERIALPCPFSWPVRIANLKRCLLASYLPVEGTDRQLVLVNLHLEAYDSGEGKIAQARQLSEFIGAEYAKGNWVIAGGDFNQVFPGSLDEYPIFTPENWLPGVFDAEALPEGFSCAFDLATPTCRLLNMPYDAAAAQHYVIDGFLISPNVRLERVETVGLGFADSDHNPVRLEVVLE